MRFLSQCYFKFPIFSSGKIEKKALERHRMSGTFPAHYFLFFPGLHPSNPEANRSDVIEGEKKNLTQKTSSQIDPLKKDFRRLH